jgi:hypothetical protein
MNAELESPGIEPGKAAQAETKRRRHVVEGKEKARHLK